MLKHSEIWQAIDRLAAVKGLSPSALARRSGLDPTTFNKSKRITKDGKQRWPSTESVSKILNATETTLTDFVRLVGDQEMVGRGQRIPLIALNGARQGEHFDERGNAAGDKWDEVLFPDIRDNNVFALEVDGDDLEPIYRDGDILVVSPGAQVRRGDRVVVGAANGRIQVYQFLRRGVRRIELRPIGPGDEELSLDSDAVAWISRIVWASQ